MDEGMGNRESEVNFKNRYQFKGGSGWIDSVIVDLRPSLHWLCVLWLDHPIENGECVDLM